MKPVEIEFLVKNNTRQGLNGVSDGVESVYKDAAAAQKQIQALEAEISRLQKITAATPKIDQTENVRQIETLQSKIKNLEADLAKMAKSAQTTSVTTKNTTLIPKDAIKAQSTFNGLNMSIQQIAREMPSLAMGPQMFFLAISNNLPIFADHIKQARTEYEMLMQAGQKATPVWKQVLKSLFSWQTALSTGIMLLVMYGKEIGDWISGLFGATDAVERNREALERRLAVEKEANAEALKTQFNIRSTITSIERFNGTKDEERRKIEELNTKYGETFGYYDTLSKWYDVLNTKAEEYIRLIFMQTKAQSLISAAVKADEKINEIKAFGAEKYRPFWGKGGKLSMFLGGSRFNNYGSDAAEIEYKKALEEQEKIRDEALNAAEFYQNSIRRSQEENGINHVIAGSIQDLENTIALKKKALKDLTNKKDYDAALAEIKTYEDKLETITGGKKKSNSKSEEWKKQSTEKLFDMEIAARQRIEEQIVELDKEGYEKQRAEAELNFQKEKQRIEDEERERLALYDKLKKHGAKLSPADRVTITAQAATQRAQAARMLDNQLAEIDKEEEENNRKKLERLLNQYQDYAAQREAIERKHNDNIAELRAQLGGDSDDLINRAIQEAEVTKQKELASVDAAQASEVFKDNDFLKRLFGNYSSMSFKSLQDLIAQARLLREYLSGNGSNEDITFISPEDLANIEKSPADLDRLRNALDKLLNTKSDGSSNKWEEIFRTFETGIAKLKGANDLNSISSAIGSISGAASSAAGELSDMLETMGNLQVADIFSNVQQIFSALSSIGEGFAKGGIIGGVGAAIGETINFISQAFAAEARHQKALEEIERAKLDFQRQYNLALLEQNLLLKEATNVFGERQVEKAANAIEIYRQAFEKLRQELEGSSSTGAYYDRFAGTWYDKLFYGGSLSLATEAYKKGIGGLWEAQIVTGHRKTGLFGWGRGEDVYSSILSVYKDLIDENGELDTVMLQTILDTQKMSDETRSYLENLIDLTDALEEAEDALDDYLTQTFGSLGEGALDAVRAAVVGTENLFKGMANNVASTLEELGEQIAYSLFFADRFDTLQQQLKDIYGSGKSQEDIAEDVMELMGAFYDGLSPNMEAAKAWFEAWQEKAKEMGFELWPSEGTSQSGKAGSVNTVTQESFSHVEGLVTSIQIHAANVDDAVEEGIVPTLSKSLDELRKIVTNTDSLPLMYDMLVKFYIEGIKVK